MCIKRVTTYHKHQSSTVIYWLSNFLFLDQWMQHILIGAPILYHQQTNVYSKWLTKWQPQNLIGTKAKSTLTHLSDSISVKLAAALAFYQFNLTTLVSDITWRTSVQRYPGSKAQTSQWWQQPPSTEANHPASTCIPDAGGLNDGKWPTGTPASLLKSNVSPFSSFFLFPAHAWVCLTLCYDRDEKQTSAHQLSDASVGFTVAFCGVVRGN